MSFWSFIRATVLPVSPAPDTLYFVSDPLDATLADAFVSGSPGNVRKIKGTSGRTGWGAYFHTGAAQSLVANTKATLVNNAGSVLQGQKPVDVATFYDGSVIPGRNGDGAAIGIEFTFTPSSALASAVTVSIDIGGSVGEIYVQEYPVLKGSGVAHKIAYIATAYMLDTWQTNGGAVKVICDGPGSITLVRYVIQRLHKAGS